MRLRILLIAFLTICLSTTYGQDKESIVQQRIEFISEQLESEEIDLTDVVALLYYRIDNPINLNAADKAP